MPELLEDLSEVENWLQNYIHLNSNKTKSDYCLRQYCPTSNHQLDHFNCQVKCEEPIGLGHLTSPEVSPNNWLEIISITWKICLKEGLCQNMNLFRLLECTFDLLEQKIPRLSSADPKCCCRTPNWNNQKNTHNSCFTVTTLVTC